MNNTDNLKTMSAIADRGIALLKAHGIYHDKLSAMLDLEYTHEETPLDLEQFLAFDDYNFAHDFAGIYTNINRATKSMDNCFLPRCSK